VLYAVTFLSGVAQAFDLPPRQALVPNVVPPEELSQALNLNTLLRQTATVLGPGIGGILVGTVGLGWSYGANGISFVALMVAVLAMGPVPAVARQRGSHWELAMGGLRYTRQQPLVLWPLVIDFCTRAIGSSRGLLPIFAKDIFLVGPEGLGWLNSALSAGAVAGGLLLGARGQVKRPVPLMIGAYVAEAVGLICVGLSSAFWVALTALFVMGIANVMAEVPRVTMQQMSTPDELRGRVSALTFMFTYGGPQIGQLDSGAMASVLGAPLAAMVGGCGALLSILIFSLPLARARKPALAAVS